MRISPFTPLFFIDRKADGIDSDYIQTFAPTDRILIEVFLHPDEDDNDWQLFMADGQLVDDIPWQEWQINDGMVLHFAILSPSPGFYKVQVGGKVSEVFKVTDDIRELERTTLIQYSHKDNLQRTDVAFFIDHMQHFFDFRVPGGFKDSNWTFSVDCEQFVTPLADISQLYAMESTQKKFTLGGNVGVPVWFGEMLNRILTCSHVYFDREKYCRKETNVPELTAQLEGVNSFVFTQMLQRSMYLDPQIEQNNLVLMRRVGECYRSTSTTENRIN